MDTTETTVAQIQLTRGMVATVDATDMALVMGYSWHAIEAAVAYDREALRLFGSFAVLNFSPIENAVEFQFSRRK